MTVEARQILDEYLLALERELRELSPADRAEIVLEIREHFEDARRELTDPTEAQLRNIVERLGTPDEIAAEARRRFGVERQPAMPDPISLTSGLPRSAYGALEILAVIGWVVWWPAGVLLMALSSRWSRRDKVIALTVELGFFVVLAGVTGTLNLIAGNGAGPRILSHYWILFVLLLFPPSVFGIAGAAFLAWRLRHPGVLPWSANSIIAGRTALIVIGAWLVWVLVLGPLTIYASHAR